MAKTGWAAVIAAVWIGAAEAASLSVTDVKIAQRYPWNGLVDITYTVNCDDSNKDVWVYPVGYDADKDVSVALMPQYLSGAGASNAVHSGTHQMTWDMAKQMGKDYNRAAFSVKLHAYCDAAPYMVIDLSAGSEAEKYDVSYLAQAKDEGWTDEYLTTKMVFRLIPPGTFMMGADQNVRTTLTKPYYFAVWPIMEQQYCLIMGGTTQSPKVFKKALSYNAIRGTKLGSFWPAHQQVDADSIVGKLRLRTGITIDLPTDAQWEYAVCAGSAQSSFVSPNAWGIRDACRLAEWCLDWGNDVISGGVDPLGLNSGSGRIARGLGFYNNGLFYGVFYRMYASYHYRNNFPSSTYLTPSTTSVEYGNRGGQGERTDFIGARLVALPVCK